MYISDTLPTHTCVKASIPAKRSFQLVLASCSRMLAGINSSAFASTSSACKNKQKIHYSVLNTTPSYQTNADSTNNVLKCLSLFSHITSHDLINAYFPIQRHSLKSAKLYYYMVVGGLLKGGN